MPRMPHVEASTAFTFCAPARRMTTTFFRPSSSRATNAVLPQPGRPARNRPGQAERRPQPASRPNGNRTPRMDLRVNECTVGHRKWPYSDRRHREQSTAEASRTVALRANSEQKKATHGQEEGEGRGL